MAGLQSIETLLVQAQTIERHIYDYIREAIEENEAFIIDMNTEDQLFERGVNRNEVDISDYAPYTPFTIQIKLEKGQPTNRVTLRDEGDFHSSFYIEYLDNGFELKASDEKTEKLIKKYGRQILGLTDGNLQEVIDDYVKPFLISKIRTILEL